MFLYLSKLENNMPLLTQRNLFHRVSPFFFFIMFFLFNSNAALAQASLVPVHNPVYDWLYHQRIAGHIPRFNFESLPIQRKDVVRYLRELESSEKLYGTQYQTLMSYLREFDINTYPDEDIHQFLVERDSNSSVRLNTSALKWGTEQEIHALKLDGKEHWGWIDLGIGNRFMQVNDGEELYRSPVSVINRVRLVAGYQQSFGLNFEYDFVTPSLSNLDTFFYDSYYASNWWIWTKKTRNGKDGNNLSHFESSATFSPFSVMNFSIGRGNQKMGTGDTNNLLFSRNAVPFTWLQLNIGVDWVRFKMLHGSLSWPSVVIQDPNYPDLTTKNSPQRFTRLSQLKMQPFNWLDLHLYEMVNYGNRGMELEYLHPFNILSMAQLNLNDQDNMMGGGIMVIRPLKGVELNAEILIDDMVDPLEIFRITRPQTSRFGRKFGLQYALNPSFRLFGEYNKIDPFVYSHPYGLNAHIQFETALGSQLPPNSDEITIGGRLLMRYRSWIDVRVSKVRNGQNIYDNAGNLVFNAGSNVNEGRNQGDADWLFLSGDPHRWVNLRVDASWEPRRSWTVSSRFEQRWMQVGNQLNDQQIFWIDLVVGI